MTMSVLLEIFISFFKVGIMTFGGGMAMLPFIQEQVVDVHGWLDASEFTSALALSMTVPGPIAVNMSTYVGYRVAGIPGSIAGLCGVVLPSFIMMLILLLFFSSFYDNARVQSALSYMKPAVIGMIAATVFLMGRGTFSDIKGVIIAGSAFVLIAFFNINPAVLMIGAGLIGVFLYTK